MSTKHTNRNATLTLKCPRCDMAMRVSLHAAVKIAKTRGKNRRAEKPAAPSV